MTKATPASTDVKGLVKRLLDAHLEWANSSSLKWPRINGHDLLRAATTLSQSTSPEGMVAVPRDALVEIAGWFREYEQGHAAKGNLDGDVKARRNAERAEIVEALFAPTPPREASQ